MASIIMSLTLIAIGSGLGISYIYDIAVIRVELFTAIMIFTSAIPVGVIMGLHIDRRPRRNAHKRTNEVSSSFDIYSIWPPAAESSGAVSGKHATDDSSEHRSGKREL